MSTRRASLGATFGRLPKEHATVRSIRLHSLLRHCGIGPVSVLKLDCEGCEFDLVPPMPDFFGGVPRIMGEFHARHVRDRFMRGHEGNVSESALNATWHTLLG